MLTDVADVLVASDRSAAAIVDEDGRLLGAITENDVVQACAEGTEYIYMITAAVWLRSGRARFPGMVTPEMTVSLETPLTEAAEKMRSRALCDMACRHLVVQDAQGALIGILSALDMARALCSSGVGMDEVDRRIGAATVAEVMKPRATLPTCSSAASMEQGVRAMLQTHQNCVIVTDAGMEDSGAVGVVTPRDVLRAFVEHMRLDMPVGHWLRGLRSALSPRVVRLDTRLVDAARIMASHSIHHLVVTRPGSEQIVGVMSSSDIAQAIGSAERVVLGFGPVGDV